MADAQTQADRGYDQVVEWLQHFEELEDPRQAAKVDKNSMRVKRRLAAWDDTYLESIVTGVG